MRSFEEEDQQCFDVFQSLFSPTLAVGSRSDSVFAHLLASVVVIVLVLLDLLGI